MSHLLDNPIWNALHTGNKNIAYGNEHAQYLKRDVGIFAGLKSNGEAELEQLAEMIPDGGVILFVPGEITIPGEWKVKVKRDILQMVYESKTVATVTRNDIVPLGEKDIPAMISLTRLTNPGPFFSRTIDFGNYEGIFSGEDLASMAGRRLQPDPYCEVSAVCTHPGHTGKGYAAKLVKSQVQSILNESRVPFLHLYPDNTPALFLYEKLGFSIRKKMIVYFLEKKQ